MNISLLTYLEREGTRGGGYLYVLVKLDSSGLGKGQTRNPIHLALVLDRSGSMAGKKLDLTKEAACRFINMLTRRDFISIIAYDTSSQVVCPHTLLIDKLYSCFNIFPSLDDAVQYLRE